MPRRSPNREDGEAGAEDRLRRIEQFLYLWLSKPRFRREIRGQYRNFRRTCRLFIPAFCARHLRRVHPQPRVQVNTISVRPQPTPPYAVADCSVQIETPSPIRPFAPTPPEHSNIGTVSFSNFEDSHRTLFPL
ncbi:hypothetical protein JTE90_029068 [Oedothorax gibbosus]|uniref:Uncharacterized protein n=1 Tax=Oedothorax gibbosus TaxID=931172 RepID=A0AAV6UWH1_9ARAC|nr:hypothetical protein JTE90_029068 [Oedothorax gibbosus]